MDKIAINEGMHLEKEWFKEAGKCTIETLPAFVDHIMNDYIHDYGTACHAVSACAIAAAWAACNQEGLTGFQAGFVMWDFVREWSYSSNKCGLSIINWDNLLYPQYEYRFRGMEIPESIWHKVVEEAQNKVKECDYAADWVIEHWKSIADGHLPFGCSIRKDD